MKFIDPFGMKISLFQSPAVVLNRKNDLFACLVFLTFN